MDKVVCPRCGALWTDTELFCPGCGVTQAFLNRPTNRLAGQPEFDVAARPTAPVHLALLVGLVVFGSGFVVQRFRQVEATSLVHELLQAGLQDHAAAPWIESVTGQWRGLGHGTFEFKGHLRSPHALRGPITGSWNPVSCQLAYHYELRLEANESAAPVLAFDGRMEQSQAGDVWLRSGTMTGAIPLRGPDSGSPER